jgi:7,8-dihydropterin-6-yl-methyl-4-(beta-D-ribofuranosyl)aminobenzene 5'-phosphate synthase
MQLTILVDNHAADGLRKEHGLSFLVDTDAGMLLFDAGQSDAWTANLRALGKDPTGIRAVCLSHGHYDHTGGLAFLPRTNRVPCYIHPECVWPRYAVDANSVRSIGVPSGVFSSGPQFVYNRTALEILPGVTLSGEIPMAVETPDPSQGRYFNDTDGRNPDMFIDEQCLIIRDGDKIAVLIGCSHRGVENNVAAAMEIAGTDRLSLLAGGMHLGRADDRRLDCAADYLSSLKIDQIVCCHCTGDRAFEFLSDRLGGRVSQGRAGMRFNVGKGTD